METSIKDLTRLIKSGTTLDMSEPHNDPEPNKPINTGKKVPKYKDKGKSAKPKKPINNRGTSEMNTFLMGMESAEYQLKEMVKVDSDVYQMFKILRPALGTPIGKLMSFVLESWVRENIASIKKVLELNDQKNKYL